MLTARAKCLRGLLAAGFVAAFAGQLMAGDECCAKKKAALTAAEQSTMPKPITHTLTLKGLTGANAGSIKTALAEFAGSVDLKPAAGTADVTWKAGTALQVSKIQKALEGTGASIDEDQWKLAGAVRLQVSGMSCGGCASAIKTALGKAEGVGEVTVDFKSSEEGYASFASSGAAYGAVRKALGDTRYQLVDASFCGNCNGGAGPCCGLCVHSAGATATTTSAAAASTGACGSAGATASTTPAANASSGTCGGCKGGTGCTCAGCAAKTKAATKSE